MSLNTFFAELRRRHVFRVVAVYLVVIWAVIQVADTVMPRLGLPDKAVTFVIILAALGLPVVFALAWVFEITPEGVKLDIQRRIPDSVPSAARESRGSRAGWFVMGMLVMVGGGWILMDHQRSAAVRPAEGVVVALPFRVSTTDPALSYLREGMIDLIAARLTESPRAVDPRTTLSAWRRTVKDPSIDLSERAAIDLAASLGAGRMLLGTVVGTPAQLTLSASLIRVPDGRSVANATVVGPADSLPALIDRLLVPLLSLNAGESEKNLAGFTGTPLPALQAYLEGKSLERRGRYDEAIERYNRALEIDSLFVLAALGNEESRRMTFTPVSISRHTPNALYNGERLSPTDRIYMNAFLPPRERTITEALNVWEHVAQDLPDRPEAWYQLGDVLFHSAAEIGVPDYLERANAALRRSIELDSTYSTPLFHLIRLTRFTGDTAFAWRAAEKYLSYERESPAARELSWDLAEARGDRQAIQRMYAGLDTASDAAIARFSRVDQLAVTPEAMRRVLRAIEVRRSRARTGDEIINTMHLAHDYHLNAGHTAKALELVRTMPRMSPIGMRVYILEDALFWQGDTTAARTAAAELEAMHLPTKNLQDAGELSSATWTLTMWKLRHNDTRGAAEAIKALRSPSQDGTPPQWNALSARILDAMLAGIERRSNADQLLSEVDEFMRTGPNGNKLPFNIAIARVYEERGDLERALAAYERHPFEGAAFRTTTLLAQGRLASRLGHKDQAIRSYRLYLALRENPDAPLKAEADQARADLAKLTAGSKR